MTNDEILALVSDIARQRAGDPQLHGFFKTLLEQSLIGLGSNSMVWRDDGTCRHRMQVNSLLHFSSNIWSQRGDDGIIRRIFQLLGVEKGFFIEFGAWDGIYLSNCRALAQRCWSGCFIEGDPAKARILRQNYLGMSDIYCLNQTVLATPGPHGKTIDEIACASFPNQKTDFMNIDVDGLDYRVFEEMHLRPTVVCVEGGFCWHPRFTQRVPEEVAARNMQQPVAVMIEIARKKSYTPICFNQNMYFVVDEQAGPFAGIQKDAVSLWRDAWFNESQAFRDSLRRNRMGAEIRSREGPEFASLEFDNPAKIPSPPSPTSGS